MPASSLPRVGRSGTRRSPIDGSPSAAIPARHFSDRTVAMKSSHHARPCRDRQPSRPAAHGADDRQGDVAFPVKQTAAPTAAAGPRLRRHLGRQPAAFRFLRVSLGSAAPRASRLPDRRWYAPVRARRRRSAGAFAGRPPHTAHSQQEAHGAPRGALSTASDAPCPAGPRAAVIPQPTDRRYQELLPCE